MGMRRGGFPSFLPHLTRSHACVHERRKEEFSSFPLSANARVCKRERRKREKKFPSCPYMHTYVRGRQGERKKERNLLLLSLTRASAPVLEMSEDEEVGERREQHHERGRVREKKGKAGGRRGK